MSEKKYATLKQFYPFYLKEHQNKICRILHFTGTTLLILSFIYFWVSVLGGSVQWFFLWVIPFIGYGFAWTGHFFFEKNKPATFQYPLFSLASDFILFWDLITGKEKFEPEETK